MTMPSRRISPPATRVGGTSSGPSTKAWHVRPATPADKHAVEALLQISYSTMLQADYDEQVLKAALPLICQANDKLLTSSTWYVVEHHRRHDGDGNDDDDDHKTPFLIGCGGWTPHSPMQQESVPNLRHFATHPSYVRQGVARAIWDRAWEDWVTYHRCTSSSSSSSPPTTPPDEQQPSNENNESTNANTTNTTATSTMSATRPDMEVISTLSAQSFYESLGFVKIKDMVVPLADNTCPFPAILMRRPDSAGGCSSMAE